MTSVVRVLQPNGVLDGNSANDLGTEIINHIQADIKIVLLDFDKVTFMNSSGIGALVSALKATKKSGGDLCICSLSAQVREIFKITKLDKLFKVFESRESFNQTVNAGALA
ncbi:MAG: STAS domain-containing protein [Cyanobacteria bacterium P01_F01_bin.53]